MNNGGKIRTTWSLAAVILAAAVSRFLFIAQGFPKRSLVDERLNIEAVAAMGPSNLNPGTFVDGGVFFYPLFLLHSVARLFPPLAGDPFGLTLIAARILVALAGILSVYVIYILVEENFDRQTGLVCALFLAVNPLHTALSRTAVSYVPMVLCCLLAVRHMFRLARVPAAGAREYLLSGLYTGLAAGSKVFGFFLVFPFAAAALISARRGGKGAAFFWSGIAVALAVFAAANPFVIIDYRGFLAAVKEAGSMAVNSFPYAVSAGQRGWGGLGGSLFYALTPAACLLALGGIIRSLRRHDWNDLLLLSFPVSFYLILGSFRYSFVRFLLPAVPFMIILAARFLSFLVFDRTRLLLAVSLCCALPMAAEVLYFGRWISQEPTEYAAQAWCRSGMPAGSLVLVDSIGGNVPGAGFLLFENPGFRVETIDWARPVDPREFFAGRDFDYVIVDASRRRPPAMAPFYAYIEDNFALRREIRPAVARRDFAFDSLYSSFNPTCNPVIRIYGRTSQETR